LLSYAAFAVKVAVLDLPNLIDALNIDQFRHPVSERLKRAQPFEIVIEPRFLVTDPAFRCL